MRGIFSWAFLFLLFAGGSSARVWDVAADGTGDAPNIQAAIDSCASGDTVLAAPGTYTGIGNRDIDFRGKAIVVMSLSGSELTIVDCGGSAGAYHRGFYLHSGEDTTSVLRGFTITNGYSGGNGGAICCVGSSPKILDNVITGNFANSGGGGVYCEGTHSIISSNTIFSNETAVWLAAERDAAAAAFPRSGRGTATAFVPASGGNICCIADSSLVESNTISDGRATLGSAILCSDSFVRVRRNNISANGGYQTEGTVCFLSGTYSIVENTITENRTWDNGAGLYCSGGEYRIAGNTISYNRFFADFGGRGGGMFCGPGSYTIENNSIIANENNAGGGIYIEGSGTVSNNLISNNGAFLVGPCANLLAASYESSLDAGGGILIDGSTSLVVAGNTIIGNHASCGGGIACIGGNPEITDNIIANNGAGHNWCSHNGNGDGIGGGILCENSSPTVTGNTIYANSTSNEYPGYRGGAAIHCTGVGSPTIRQNIIANNQTSSEQGVGGIFCADLTSIPSVSCNDVYGNTNADYGGTLADQTGLNGNFSLDPLFCGAESGDFELHVLSPCLAGHHPDGGDCGRIGAREAACDFVATLLQGYSASVSTSAVTITWTLAQAGENLTCSVLRAEAEVGEYRELAAPGVARDGMTFTFNDAGVDPGTAYRYRVDVSDSEGRKVLFETSRIVTPALPFSLDQNFPNPFNPSTVIAYYLPEDSPVTLAVYDVSGRRVADLVGKAEKKGRHSVTWNGSDGTGGSIASGIYFYRLTAGKETVSKKMILLR